MHRRIFPGITDQQVPGNLKRDENEATRHTASTFDWLSVSEGSQSQNLEMLRRASSRHFIQWLAQHSPMIDALFFLS